MSDGLIGVLSRWAVFTGLLLAVGAVVFVLRICRASENEGVPGSEESSDTESSPDADDSPEGRLHPTSLAGRLAALGLLLVVLGPLGRLWSELSVFRDPFEPWASELRLLVTATSFGRAWMAQFGLGVFACLAFVVASKSSGWGRVTPSWLLAALFTAALAFTPAFSGHAAGSSHLRGLAIGSDVLHVLAGGAWLGTLAVLAWVAARRRSSGHPVGRELLIEWVSRFSPIALFSAAALGVTGVFASWLHLDAVSSLWSTPYGQRLLIKIGVLTVILGFGALNWKRSRGQIALSGEPARLPRSVAAELAAGLAILLVTALLVTTPPPGE